MSLKIKFDRLDYQEKAVNSISNVFKNIAFKPNSNAKSNPSFSLTASKPMLAENIKEVREQNAISIGDVSIKDELVLDTLMETGTGKTFTFLESIYRLNRDYGLSKFIILVPSNAIRQGTLKNIAITKEFFVKEYGKSISVFNYSDKTIGNYVNNSNQNISVLVSTYQSFNKAKNTINKRGVEQSLIGRAKSYMEAVAELRPVIVIDEPHRFEGKQTTEYLKKFNPLFTLRFGATFKDDVYKNLLYTLDSIDAFSGGLVKGISVDTIGNKNIDDHTLELKKVVGRTQKDYVATIAYKDIEAKNKTCALSKGDNFGEVVGIAYLNAYVVEKITKKEILFSNGISLLLDEVESYGVLFDEMQKVIVDRAIKNHFEREEELFKLGIKAVCLFFIDGVSKYLQDDGSQGVLAELFEKLYLKNLNEVLTKNLDEAYRTYLERSKENIAQVHHGYFAKSSKIKDEEEAIALILNKKEELLSFDTDLRFIFSQWALQEGWDNPNVFTLCKLAPSNSKITKLQQIGRGLRLAVNQKGERITKEHEDFDFVNELFVVVPSTEEDFVASIQNEISEHSVKKVAKLFNEEIMVENEIATTARFAVRLLDELEDLGFISIDDDDGMSEITISKEAYDKEVKALKEIEMKGVDNQKLKAYFDAFFKTTNRIKTKESRQAKKKQHIKINAQNFKRFQTLWESLNHEATIKYEIDSEVLIGSAIESINNDFSIGGQDIIIRTDKEVENLEVHHSYDETIKVESTSIFTLYEFVKSLSNATKLSMQTVSTVLSKINKEKFLLIASNENMALGRLKDIFIGAIYEVIVNKISYDIKEVKVNNTAFIDKNGNLREALKGGALGKEVYPIRNKSVLEKSIYDEKFMEVDSEIEKVTIDESMHQKITVFGKLPSLKIPTPHGKSYSPDFAYVIDNGESSELYLVVETKGYDAFSEIGNAEKLKIKSAERFFESLKEQKGIEVSFRTKINGNELSQMISEMNLV
ncbi:MAG: Type III restriction-modification system restriction subunit (EC [uncultured Sulfurovum sp.]|uniref:Type III restriction-modification system restriction subunit (EC) n=1 Tax=uncultured Sulfurovum sp. TaxID=269237 RepID=A0A6S6SM71_9BACT|nr:MAG: Type III restriction-modification system restriction subunit (EC [uncultured Sulfurovum sp.]